ncbi:MAG: pyruvate kinase [Lewinella sp.]|nr:pyruvate kinase [Lewinella sp.]
MTPSPVATISLYEEEKIQSIIQQMLDVRKTIAQREEEYNSWLRELHPQHIDSARNLIRYLALRTFNLRDLQAELSKIGLSSIGTSERYTLANIDNVLHLLYLLTGRRYYGDQLHHEHKTTVLSSWEKLQRNTINLFGNSAKHRPHIMVTMPSEAADNYDLVCHLLNSGMNVARINCGHDDEIVWKKMIDNIRRGEAELGKSCKVYMDLAGPKIRTGEVAVIGKKKKGKKVIDYISLEIGDPLHLHSNSILGRNAIHSKDGHILRPAKISITLPQVFEGLEEGQPIWFDDGKIGAVVKFVREDHALLEITHTGLKGGRLRAEKGINVPETDFKLPSLTDEDLSVLPFVAQYADIVGYSFVRYPVDVETLRQKLLELDRPDIGIVLKIENQAAFNNLPALLLTAMKHPAIGVMIARGDLAVEVGWERISEVQEEILWICEAAHIPIIWATQVLESLAKKGTASRAEITDAAMANRAECVMLNKGPFIFEAVQLLENILSRMYAHQWKKKETLRTLSVAKRFFDTTNG